MAVVLYIKWTMSGDIMDHKVIEVSDNEKELLIKRHGGGNNPKYVDVKNAFRYGLEVEVQPVGKKVVKEPVIETKAVEEPVIVPEKPVKKVIFAKSEIK